MLTVLLEMHTGRSLAAEKKLKCKSRDLTLPKPCFTVPEKVITILHVSASVSIG